MKYTDNDYELLNKKYVQKCAELELKTKQFENTMHDLKDDLKNLIQDFDPYLAIPHYFFSLDPIAFDALPETVQEVLNQLPGTKSEMLKQKWGMWVKSKISMKSNPS